MNRDKAKTILLLYRPEEEPDAEMREALEMAARDPELKAWFEQSRAFDALVREKFAELPVPPLPTLDLALAEVRPGPAVWWRRPSVRAGLAALLIGTLFLTWWQRSSPHHRFDDYRRRMVGTALREYRMDIVTNNEAAIRAFLSASGAPANYSVAPTLAEIPLAGAGRLNWQGQPVSMVCFQRAENDTLFLFIMQPAMPLEGAPDAPEITKVNKLTTAAWRRGPTLYLLAGTGDPQSFRRYIE